MLEEARGDAANDGARSYVFGDDGSGGHYGAVAHGDAGKDGGVGANPYVFADVDGSVGHALAFVGIRVVVECGEHHVVANECALVDGDAALILKFAAHVDEHTIGDDGVLSAIGVKRRKHSYGSWHFATPQLLE